MPHVHPTAIIEGDVELADDAAVGPHCVLTGPISIGVGTRLIGNVYVQGPATIGRANTIYPFTCLGFAPQSVHVEPDRPGPGLEIGDRNTLREGVTIHRAMTDDGPTRIGNDNYFMADCHAGHDVQLANGCTLANGVLLGGHVDVADGVTMGGNSGVHQFCRIGRGAMLAGNASTTRDVLPFFTLTAINVCGSINVVGLRRDGTPRDRIDDVRWVYRTINKGGHSLKHALAALRERRERPMVAELVHFIETSERGICTGHQSIARVRRTADAT